MEINKVYVEPNLDTMGRMPDGFVNCIVTSPPYFGLRDYGLPPDRWPEVRYKPMVGLPEVVIPAMECCLGLESTPDAFIGHLVHIFREGRRVLKQEGLVWVNLGDSYARSAGDDSKKNPDSSMRTGRTGKADQLFKQGNNRPPAGLKQKDLIGIPWRFAFAMQADGWFLRQDIIWAKPNPMPESVRDRCTKSHEYLFLLSKRPKYYFDSKAIREPGKSYTKKASGYKDQHIYGVQDGRRGLGFATRDITTVGRNKRSVWTVTTKPFKEAHFATFPPDLIEPCVLAGCPEGGIVYDPFGGSGTTAAVAARHKRNWVLSELNPEYAQLVPKRMEVKTEKVKKERAPKDLKPKKDKHSGQYGLFE